MGNCRKGIVRGMLVLEGIILGGIIWWIMGIVDVKSEEQELVKAEESVWEIYNEDFIWEQEITDGLTGKRYVCCYTQDFNEEMAAMNEGVYYEGKLYVFDENKDLVRVWQSEIIDPFSGGTWKEEEQELVLHYGETGQSVLSMEILTDWRYGG